LVESKNWIKPLTYFSSKPFSPNCLTFSFKFEVFEMVLLSKIVYTQSSNLTPYSVNLSSKSDRVYFSGCYKILSISSIFSSVNPSSYSSILFKSSFAAVSIFVVVTSTPASDNF